MRTKLTIEQKAANALAKKVERAAAKELERFAKQQARQALWDAEKQRRIDAFKAGMDEATWADLQTALAEPSTTPDEVAGGGYRITNDFLFSVQEQFKSRGYLSDRQRDLLVGRVRERREQAQKAEAWAVVAEGDAVKLYCTVISTERVSDTYGISYKIRLLSHYGRKFSFKTTRDYWRDYAEKAKELGKKVFVQGKVKWVAPDAGGPVVLTSRGMKFGDLV